MTATTPPPPARALAHRTLDFWLLGGASLLAWAFYMLFQGIALAPVDLLFSRLGAGALGLQLVVNYPHFMASYLILYRTRESIRTYPSASLGVPAALVAIAIFGALTVAAGEGESRLIAQQTVFLLGCGASVYLAWHYTGQAWGMTASFCWLAGIRVDERERLCRRGGRAGDRRNIGLAVEAHVHSPFPAIGGEGAEGDRCVRRAGAIAGDRPDRLPDVDGAEDAEIFEEEVASDVEGSGIEFDASTHGDPRFIRQLEAHPHRLVDDDGSTIEHQTNFVVRRGIHLSVGDPQVALEVGARAALDDEGRALVVADGRPACC